MERLSYGKKYMAGKDGLQGMPVSEMKQLLVTIGRPYPKGKRFQLCELIEQAYRNGSIK